MNEQQRTGAGAGGTGFIIAPAHTLQPDVKTENILAMYEEIDQLEGMTR